MKNNLTNSQISFNVMYILLILEFISIKTKRKNDYNL